MGTQDSSILRNHRWHCCRAHLEKQREIWPTSGPSQMRARGNAAAAAAAAAMSQGDCERARGHSCGGDAFRSAGLRVRRQQCEGAAKGGPPLRAGLDSARPIAAAPLVVAAAHLATWRRPGDLRHSTRGLWRRRQICHCVARGPSFRRHHTLADSISSSGARSLPFAWFFPRRSFLSFSFLLSTSHECFLSVGLRKCQRRVL